MIRQALISDAQGIVEIYNHYVMNSIATFEEETVSVDEIQNRIEETQGNGLPWIVAEEFCNTSQEAKVIGYAYAGKWKGRCAYRFSVEVTVYLAPNIEGKGWGSKLYDSLFSLLRSRSIHVVMAGISLPNPSSIALHEKFGMKQVAEFKEIGFKFNKWVDVGYWQRALVEKVNME